MEELKRKIREIPDFPKPGINFYDVTTLLRDRDGFRTVIDLMSRQFFNRGVEQVLGIESRGFILGPALAYNLNAGFVPVRKPGKLPYRTLTACYELEYGEDCLQIHEDAVEPGQKIIIVDDLIATGGTASATVELANQLGAEVLGVAFMVELEFLKGREKLNGVDVYSLLKY